tara:strand:+ start:110 stop:628 length:519 start_codon:yes stop_codon:yes gene_type:complete
MFAFTYKNGDVIELKNIKHSEFASEETHCYEASVYFNGKKIGVVSNHGHGASDDFDGDYKIWRELEVRMKSDHPQYHLEWDDSWNDMSMEIWCGEQVNRFLSHKDFKKYMKSKVVFIDPTSDKPNAVRYFSFKGVRKITQQHIDHIVSKYKDYKILNALPEAEAWKLWQAGA